MEGGNAGSFRHRSNGKCCFTDGEADGASDLDDDERPVEEWATFMAMFVAPGAARRRALVITATAMDMTRVCSLSVYGRISLVGVDFTCGWRGDVRPGSGGRAEVQRVGAQDATSADLRS